MADVYDLSDYDVSDPYIGGQMVVMWFQAGDSSMKAGYLCMDDDADEVKVCAVDGQPFALVGKMPTVDIDTEITSGDGMFVYLPAGTLVWMAHDTADQTVNKGSIIDRSDAVAGKVETATDITAISIARSAELIATGGDSVWFKALLGL